MHTARMALAALSLSAAITAQVTWTQSTPAVTPGARWRHAMAYDEARARTVLFGGQSGALTKGDTWIHDGTTWNQLAVPGPGARANHTMVYDSLRQVVVLFGGYLAGAPSANNETWEWDGVSWTQRFPATSPPPRHTCASAPWPALGGVVIHGGYPNDGTPHFWLWDGVDWTDLTIADTPYDYSHSMAYHAGLQQLLVMGPNTVATWNGSEWLPTDGSAGLRRDGRLVYDPVRERVLAFGGYYGGSFFDPLHETWVWRGLWARLDAPAQYLGRADFGMVFDTANNQVVAHGGVYADSFDIVELDDTLTLSPITLPPPYSDPELVGFGFTNDCRHVGDGVFSTTFQPILNAGGEHAWVDETFHLGCAAGGAFAPAIAMLVYGTSNQFWNGVPLPIDLGALGRPDCMLEVEALVTQAVVAAGSASFAVPIPNVPTLAGSEHFFQIVGVSPLGQLFTTNGLGIAVGDR